MLVIAQENFSAEIQQTLTEFEEKYEQLKEACSSRATMEEKIREITEQFTTERDRIKSFMKRDEERFEEMRAELALKSEIGQQMERNVQKQESKRKRLQTDITQLEKDIAERIES